MPLRYGQKYIKLGDTTTHGGKVISASFPFSQNGDTLARPGDLVYCPRCDNIFEIERAPLVVGFGKDIPYAIEGQGTTCGATLIAAPCADPEIERKRADTALRKSGGGGLSACVVPPFASSNQGSKEPWRGKEEKLASLVVNLTNEDHRFLEYLPCRVTVSKGSEIVTKELAAGERYVGTFKQGDYKVSIKPVPPPGEELGPIPVQSNGKFERTVYIPDGYEKDEVHLDIKVTRKESIEHNIMMTFLVEEPANQEWYFTLHRWHARSTHFGHAHLVVKWADYFGLPYDLVNACIYIEETQGWNDSVYDYAPRVLADNYEFWREKSIRPMNVNIQYWEKLFAARGIFRRNLYDADTNIREGCFLMHRVHVRASPQTPKTTASLYNAHKAQVHDKYAFYFDQVYPGKSWLKASLEEVNNNG